jgi:hypothetical protein
MRQQECCGEQTRAGKGMYRSVIARAHADGAFNLRASEPGSQRINERAFLECSCIKGPAIQFGNLPVTNVCVG